jgi:hypothetical protein
MKRSIAPVVTNAGVLFAVLIATGCGTARRDPTAAYFRPHSAETVYISNQSLRDEAVGAPGANSGLQQGGANPGDSSRQNTDESEPPRKPQ